MADQDDHPARAVAGRARRPSRAARVARRGQTCYPSRAMIAIVDYDAGNLRSVKRACDAVGIDALVHAGPGARRQGRQGHLPGRRTRASAMDTLIRTGMREAILDAFRARHADPRHLRRRAAGARRLGRRPDTPASRLIPGMTRALPARRPARSRSRTSAGTRCRSRSRTPLLDGLAPGDELYFVHSYLPRSERRSARVYAAARLRRRLLLRDRPRQPVRDAVPPGEERAARARRLVDASRRWDGTPC